MVDGTWNASHQVVKDVYLFPCFCIRTPCVINGLRQLFPHRRYHSAHPSWEEFVHNTLMIWVSEYMRVTKRVRAFKNVVVEL